MIFVQRPAPPPVLQGKAAVKERERVELWFSDTTTQKQPCKRFAIYKHPDVVAALTETFAGKCAYCESRYAPMMPVDVEHFRPKGGYEYEGVLQVPGYWWLASEWSNLLPSCIDCNRARTHKFLDRRERALSGKANRFPLSDESKRATAKGEEKRERALLLNPCEDRPEKHLGFDEQGLVTARRRSAKGQTSIEVYGLNRDGLVGARKAELRHLLAAIKRVVEINEDIEKYPNDASFRGRLRAAVAELDTYTDGTSSYAQMARQILDRFKAELT
jgi:uncharacterized protein (TIGR02646 family)